jgi:hypothetical protein
MLDGGSLESLSSFSNARLLEHLARSGTKAPMGEKIQRKCGEQGRRARRVLGTSEGLPE